jgi:adenine specific DNA methylase Mod
LLPLPITENYLFYGDNLDVLRQHIPTQSIDLIYLDPPFNSSRNYNVLFKDEHGTESEAQITAFEDTWHWNLAAEQTYAELLTETPDHVAKMVESLRDFIGTNQMMAYLVMMAARLVELHRVLKPTGSLYLHCDPTASHYLKIILDTIFAPQNFRNEIVWKRTHAHSDTKQGRKGYGSISDIILYYTKSDIYTFNTQFLAYSQEYMDKYYRYKDPEGRRYWLDNLTGPGGAAKGNPYYEVMGVWRYWRYSKEKMDELIRQGRIVQSKPGNVPQ